jgi:hypothetical protein
VVFESAWTVERHSGKPSDRWRQIYSGEQSQARARFPQEAEALRAGGLRLLQPDGTQELLVTSPRLRTRSWPT